MTLFIVKSARRESPGMLTHVPDTWTSTFGIVYVASPRKSVL
jgi:hypothetical protein